MSAVRSPHPLRGYVGLSLVWLAVMGIALFVTRKPAGKSIEILPPPTAAPTATPAPSPTPGPLHVDVAGAVQSPGVYRLPSGALVVDAIAAAGGPTADADLDRINKAIALQDGMQVYVPRAAEAARPSLITPVVPAPTRLAATAGGGKKVNLNTASLAELDTLPGVGPSIAQAIINGRPYGKTEDVMRVDGIAQATFDKLKDLITVE